MDDRDYSADIAKALATPGGHLHVGQAGWTLHYVNESGGRSSLSWYCAEKIKAQAIAAAPMIVERCARVADMEVDKCIEAAWRLEAEGHSEDADRCRQHAERAGYVAANIRALASKEDG